MLSGCWQVRFGTFRCHWKRRRNFFEAFPETFLVTSAVISVVCPRFRHLTACEATQTCNLPLLFTLVFSLSLFLSFLHKQAKNFLSGRDSCCTLQSKSPTSLPFLISFLYCCPPYSSLVLLRTCTWSQLIRRGLHSRHKLWGKWPDAEVQSKVCATNDAQSTYEENFDKKNKHNSESEENAFLVCF